MLNKQAEEKIIKKQNHEKTDDRKERVSQASGNVDHHGNHYGHFICEPGFFRRRPFHWISGSSPGK